MPASPCSAAPVRPSPGARPHRPATHRLLAGLLLVSACAAAPADGLAPFTTDGCSMFPDRSPDGKVDWCDCCLAHDLAYWRGGTEEGRLQADRQLKSCVERRTGNRPLAEAMFLGVRAGGGPQARTSYRWGYGWPYGRGYRALTEAEAAEAQGLEDDYRARNPGLQCEAAKLPSGERGAAASPPACDARHGEAP